MAPIAGDDDAMSPPALLDIAGLTVSFPTEDGKFTAVRSLDLRVASGETVAIVGESGSGKSVTALAMTRLIDYGSGRIEAGTIRYRDRDGRVRDLARETPEAMRRLRGPELAM